MSICLKVLKVVITRFLDTWVTTPKQCIICVLPSACSGSGTLLDKPGSELGWYDASEQLEGAPSATLSEPQHPAQVLPALPAEPPHALQRMCMKCQCHLPMLPAGNRLALGTEDGCTCNLR